MATQQRTYKPGDWVIYQGTKDRYRGWHFEVASTNGEWLDLVEAGGPIWDINLRCRAASVVPCFPQQD